MRLFLLLRLAVAICNEKSTLFWHTDLSEADDKKHITNLTVSVCLVGTALVSESGGFWELRSRFEPGNIFKE